VARQLRKAARAKRSNKSGSRCRLKGRRQPQKSNFKWPRFSGSGQFPLIFMLYAGVAHTQPCDPSVTPTGLAATYTPGTGVLLEWDAVPASAGVAIRSTSPLGTTISRRLMGPELDQYLVPDAALSPGFYLWQVQAACTTAPPYDVTPVSDFGSFTVSGTACPASVTDVDGNTYATVPMGSQGWMAENLRTATYRNGDAISTDLLMAAWASTTIGAFAVYNNDTTSRVPYGLLYNWYALDNARGVCPVGWHVPADGEFDDLELHLRLLGGPAGAKMKSTETLGDGTGGTLPQRLNHEPVAKHYSSVKLDIGCPCRARFAALAHKRNRTHIASFAANEQEVRCRSKFPKSKATELYAVHSAGSGCGDR